MRKEMKRSFAKRSVCIGMSALMLFGSIGMVPALAAPEDDTATAVVSQQNTTGDLLLIGTISEWGENQLVLTDSDNNQTVLNLNGDTYVVGAVDGELLGRDDLQDGELVYAYVSRAMTRSLPPITNASMIIANIPADFAVPTFAEIQSVTRNDDGSVTAVTDQDVIYTIARDTAIRPYLTRNIVTIDDLLPGTKILAWADVMTLSMPAQANPNKITVFPYEYAGRIAVDGLGLTLNEEALSFGSGAPYYSGDILMVPVRQIAEYFGSVVEFEAATRTVSIMNGDVEVFAVTEGQEYARKDGVELALIAPVRIASGVTYMALGDLVSLLGLKLVD